MTNAEFYAERIKNFNGANFCNEFIKPIVRNEDCDGTDCCYCNIRMALWLQEEHKQPPIDWENVPVDTPILVKQSNEEQFHKRHFAYYKDGKIYAWVNGQTSYTCNNDKSRTVNWLHAKLLEK